MTSFFLGLFSDSTMDDQTEQEKASDQIDGGTIKRCGTCMVKTKSYKVSMNCKECERRWKNDAESRKGEHSQFDVHGLDICQIHKKCFEFFCQTHQDFICRSCFFTNHKDCKNIQEHQTFAKSVVSKDDKHMVDGLVKYVELAANGLVADIGNAHSEIGNQENTLNASLKVMRHSIVKAFDDLSKNITKQADALKEQKAKQLDQKTIAIIDMSMHWQLSWDFLSVTLANGSQTQKQSP